jgi:hypothetical protein
MVAARARLDRKAREEILEKIRQKLAVKNVKAKHFITNKSYRKYISIEGSKPVLNKQAIKEGVAERWIFGNYH